MKEFEKEQVHACEYVKNIINKNRLSHAYIIEANQYDRKNEFAYDFARLLSNNSVDIEIIKPDGMWIKKEQIENLQKNFTIKSLSGSNKVYIIQDADKLNNTSANTLLKFLEEPEDNIVAILVVDNLYQLLPTIKSRCQTITLVNSRKIALENNEESIIVDFIDFLENIEKRKKDVILYENVMFLKKYKKKELISYFLDVSLNFYKEVMDYMLDREIKQFIAFEDKIKNIEKINSINSICDKINVISEKKEHLKINENLNLLIDDLIIKLSEV